jgi:hypothetical protein
MKNVEKLFAQHFSKNIDFKNINQHLSKNVDNVVKNVDPTKMLTRYF